MRISDWSSDVCSSDLVALPFAFGKSRARLAVARQRRMTGDRGAIAGKVQMVHRRRDRRGGIARQCLAVERCDPFGRPAQQRGEGLLLREPADRRDLQVRLAEIIARLETEPDEARTEGHTSERQSI